MKKTTLSGIIIGVSALLTIIAVIILVGNSSPAKKAAKQLDLGYKFLSAEEYDEAIAAFERAIEIDPNNMEAYLGLAEAYIGKGDYEKAENVLSDGLEAFISDNENNKILLEKYVSFIRKYLEECDFDSAKSGLRDIIDKLGEVGKKEEAEQLEKALNEMEEDAEDIDNSNESKTDKSEESSGKDEDEKNELMSPETDPNAIVFMPVLDRLQNVWGRSWLEWTPADYISEFGLEKCPTNFGNISAWHDAGVEQDSAGIGYRTVTLDGDAVYMTYNRNPEKLFFPDQLTDGITSDGVKVRHYNKVLAGSSWQPEEDEVYRFASERNLFSTEQVLAYIGVKTDYNGQKNDAVDILTDLGPAKVYFDDRGLVIEFAKDAEINIIKFYNSQGGFFISADHHY